MFENIGGKIKTLATVLCWIGIVCYIIVGLVMLFTNGFLLGLVVGAGGALLSWISSFVLYGFGQLIENSDTIVGQNRRLLNAKSDHPQNNTMPKSNTIPKSNYSSNNPSGVTHNWICNSCGNMISESPCPYCGK